MRSGVVQHELAKQPTIVDKRDKPKGADAFRLKDFTQCSKAVVGKDVFHDDRQRIPYIRRPRRVAVDRHTVRIR